MIHYEVIDVGPAMNEWLQSRVQGYEWTLSRVRARGSKELPDKRYQLVIFDNNGRGVYSRTEKHTNDEHAINWAKDTFVTEMMNRGFLPRMGLIIE